ncbi:MAG: Stp1/IreP family PP2C-type Ser/Thr phosphatase [bacterium]
MVGIGDCHSGIIRKVNQDYIYINNQPIGVLDNLYIVADGVGGHKAGEVASEASIDFFEQYILENEEEILDLMVSAVCYANEEVYKLSKMNPNYHNMGTTLLAVTYKYNKLFIVHVGDSRLYGVRDGEIIQITADHTYAMDLFKAGLISKDEARKCKETNVLTRAVGTEKTIKADALFCEVDYGDTFLLCSDGLTDMVSDEDILDIVQSRNLPLEVRVNELIKRANNNGGKDNIAVIIIE